jgi:uncharacterized membrane protein
MGNHQENERLNTPVTNAETAAESRAEAMNEQDEERLQALSAELESMNNESEGY